MERKLVFTSRDVVFREKTFSFQTSIVTPKPIHPLVLSPILPQVDDDVSSKVETEHPTPAPTTHINTENAENVHVVPEHVPELLGRGHRGKKPSTRL